MSGNHVRKSRHIEVWVEEQMIRMGYQLVSANRRVAGVEVDRIFKNSEGDLVLCEIKTMSDWGYLLNRVHEKQKRRLRRAQALLASGLRGSGVLLYFCYFHIESCELRVYDDLGHWIIDLRRDPHGLD